ncbi:hypothetical protein B0H34DRAFT_799697 [Crassisporium funariophilum]|nr:hypothetical protein B0H34DRAFT_799697 [Crassisporium funariophilum]
MANRKKTGKEAAPAAAPAPAPPPPSDAKEKKPQAKAIKWEDHPDWTTRAIQHLEKFKAKLRKMELEAKRSEQQFKLFRMMISCGKGSSSQAQQGMGTVDSLFPLTSTSDAGLPSTSTSDVGWNFGPNDIPQVEVGDFTAELNKVQWPGNDANQNTGH